VLNEENDRERDKEREIGKKKMLLPIKRKCEEVMSKRRFLFWLLHS